MGRLCRLTSSFSNHLALKMPSVQRLEQPLKIKNEIKSLKLDTPYFKNVFIDHMQGYFTSIARAVKNAINE